MIAPLLAVLKVIPLWVWPIAALAASTWWYRHQYLDVSEEYTQAKADAKAARQMQEKTDAIITDQRKEDIAEAGRIATKQISERDGALARARAGRDQLLTDLASRDADIRAARASAPAASAPACEATGVPTDVFGRFVDRTIELASYADEARIAGEACQRAYQAVVRAQPLKESD